ncbi:hypothetical protein NPX13_g4979 [Xylaria arbuscula]|uniref:Uncharacterized protein n=1 Tax=Xylaria arbuscula TaxID=114810 RepID=A0A9W8TNK8_9PEZI|nr:hypothetical protein NPX13_g4979 [Xylaria arbuscula]
MATSIDPNEESLYLKYLMSKNEYKPWMRSLSPTEPLSGLSFIGFKVLDITSSGISSSQRYRPDDNYANLKDIAFSHGTRLIVFERESRPLVQDRIGPMHEVEPEFFRAVAESHVPEYLVGGRPRHLSLGYGWTAVIKRRNSLLVSSTNYTRSSCFERRRGHNLTLGPSYAFLHDEYYNTVYLRRNKSFYVNAHQNPLLLLLPILEVHAAFLTEELDDAEACFRSARMSNELDLTEIAWDSLRMMKHDGMNPLKCVELYARSNEEGEILESDEFKKLKERFQRIEDQISCTEALTRDYLQHQVGRASLEDSRASIKQARISIEESRRTKLVTVLAIFFVPISLSTSVFDMNIDELNENGQSLWVFVLTTVFIVAATMTIWGTMYQWQKYNSLPKGGHEGKSWLTRFRCLLHLVFHRHSIWAWKSGILVSLLMDGRVAFLRSCRSCMFDGFYYGNAPHTANHDVHKPCGYIMDHVGSRGAFKLSDLEDQLDAKREE